MATDKTYEDGLRATHEEAFNAGYQQGYGQGAIAGRGHGGHVDPSRERGERGNSSRAP